MGNLSASRTNFHSLCGVVCAQAQLLGTHPGNCFVSAAGKPWCRLSILTHRTKCEVHLTVTDLLQKFMRAIYNNVVLSHILTAQKGRSWTPEAAHGITSFTLFPEHKPLSSAGLVNRTIQLLQGHSRKTLGPYVPKALNGHGD